MKLMKPIMKRSLFAFLFLIVVVIFCGIGIFFGVILAHSNEPRLVVRNLSHAVVVNVSAKTDVGESYTINEVPSHQSRDLKISGRNKSLWIVGKLDNGKELTSEKIYVSSEGIVFTAITDDDIDLDYEP
jgi:hypothetical protein